MAPAYFQSMRKAHLIGVAALAGLGILSLTANKGILAFILIALAAAGIYLAVLVVLRVMKARDASPQELNGYMCDLLEVMLLALLLGVASGFWSGFAAVVLDSSLRVRQVQQALWPTVMGFSSVFAVALAFVVPMGFVALSRHR